MRYKQVRTYQGQTTTTYYLGKGFEVEKKGTQTTEHSYISDIAILTEVNNSPTIRFTHKDRLGSTTTFTDRYGNALGYRSYDPFGKPRMGNNSPMSRYAKDARLVNNINDTSNPIRRGFTDHEHLDEAELIHMNGRVYDYNLGRFMSVDPFIQGVGNSQGINPYSYVMNNPLGYTDPSGYSALARGGSICHGQAYCGDDMGRIDNKDSSGNNGKGTIINDNEPPQDKGSETNKAKRDAAISEDVYEDTSKLNPEDGVFRLTYEELKALGLGTVQFEHESSGFKSALYFDSVNTEFVIAFAGTENFVDLPNLSFSADMLANFSQGLGKFSKQHDLAVNNSRIINKVIGQLIHDGKLGSSTISTTGHSLGGGLAALAAAKNNMTSNTFNSAGLSSKTIQNFCINSSNFSKVNAYYVRGEILILLQDSSILPNAQGNRIPLDPVNKSNWYTPPYKRVQRSLTSHFISNVNASMQGIR